MIKLNLGCGNKPLEGYINIDKEDYPNSIQMNALNLLYKDNSVDLIRAEHLIEHFNMTGIKVFFKECKRVLKPSGSLIIIAPDMATVLDRWKRGVEGYDLDYLDLFLFAHHRINDGHKQGIYKKKLLNWFKEYDFILKEVKNQDRENSRNEIFAEVIKGGT